MASNGTVLVNLKRDWFGPDGSLYEARDNPHEFPATYVAEPKQKEKESDEDFAARKKVQPYDVLPSSAEVMEGGGRTVVTLQDTANGTQLKVPTAVPDDVKSVGGAIDEKGNEQPSQSVADAESAAEELGMQVGGKPRESGPLPAGTKKK